MSDFGKETCATAIAATVADPSQHRVVEIEAVESGVVGKESGFSGEESIDLSGPLQKCWNRLVQPLLQRLDEHMDVRLVRTLERTIASVVKHRHSKNGLLLSELGGFICDAAHAPAGTKRLSNLLRSPKWRADEISDHLWERAVVTWENMIGAGEAVYLLWDESVIEKPESLQSEGLSPVRSSKAKRLSRIKPGFYRPPGAPVFVPGIHWLALLLIGRSGPPVVASMKWWGTRCPQIGATATATVTATAVDSPVWLRHGREVARELLSQCAHYFGLGVVHIFDRGYAGEPWLNQLDSFGVRFIIRWFKDYPLTGPDGLEAGRKAAWKYLHGKRSWGKRMIRDSPRQREHEVGVIAVQVTHPGYGFGRCPLWLVASRPGKGREPWYLLTNEPIETIQDAWDIVFAYARRWQIEGCFRFNKTELALESPRVWTWEGRLKLLMIVTLVYSLLLELLQLPLDWREALFRKWCHRTGKRSRDTPTPLYRLRTALAASIKHQHLENFKSSG